MSAPKTDLDKQQKRHRPALLGIRASLLWAGVLLVLLVVWLAFVGNEPEDQEGVEVPAPVVSE